jgi:3-phenylpropionate/trans-cinnamate dioxygenase ferredoxin subunit
MTETAERFRVASVGDVENESAIGVIADGTPVCLARSGGVLYALRNLCSHADVALSEGEIEDGRVECWLHGSTFSLSTGEPSGLPATKPVPTYLVTTEGDDVYVTLTSPGA